MLRPPKGNPDGWGVWKGRRAAKSSWHGQPAPAIQHLLAHTATFATQITCCTQHLVAVHGDQEIQGDHEAGGDWKSLRPIPTGCYTGTPTLGFPCRPADHQARPRGSHAHENFCPPESRTSKPSGCLRKSPMGRAQHVGRQHRSHIHSTPNTHPQASPKPQLPRRVRVDCAGLPDRPGL